VRSKRSGSRIKIQDPCKPTDKVGAWLKGGELELLRIVDILLKCRIISKAEQYGFTSWKKAKIGFLL
jgi:hypothetical protein